MVIPCLTENLTFSLIRLGMLDDPPDYVTSQAMLDFGDEDAAKGHEGFDKQKAALKDLL